MTQLLINKIRLENFLSHRETEITLVRGVNVFVGPNGAGKTSILEAIHFALTGKGWRTNGRNRRDLVNKNASTALVELEFTLGEDKYTVRRRIGGPGTLLLRNGKTIVRDEVSLNKELSEIIGIDPEKLRNLALIPQGGITRIFVEERPSDRKKILDMILGLQEYDEAGQKLVKISIASKSRFFTLITPTQVGRKKDIERIQERVNREYEKIKREIEEIERELREARSRLEEIKHEIEANRLREKAKSLIEVEEKHGKLIQRIGELKGKISRVKRELEERKIEEENTRRELKVIEDKIRGYEEKTRILEYEEEVSKLKEKIEKHKTITIQLDQLKRELESLRELEGKIRVLREKYPRSSREVSEEKQQLEEELNRINDELRRLREKIASIKTKKNNIREQLNKYEKIISDARRKLSRIDKTLAGISEDKLVKQVVELKNKLSRVKENLEEETNNILVEIERLKEAIADLREKKELLEKTKSPTCPLCGSPLTEEHRERIVRELEEKIRENTRRLRELEEKHRRLAGEKQVVLRRIEELEDPVFTKLIEAVEEKAKLTREYEELERKLEQAEKELKRALERENKVSDKIKRIGEEYTGAIKREALEKTFDENRYKSLLRVEEELLGELDSLRREIEDSSNKLRRILGVGETSSEKLLEYAKNRIEEARRAKDELIRLKARREDLSKRLISIGEELEKLAKDYNTLIEEHRRLLSEEEKLASLLEEARRARDRLTLLEKELSRLEGVINTREKALNDKLRELEELEKEVDEANKAIRKALIAKWIRDNLFHKDGVPKHLRRRYIAHLESLMENLMNKFNLEYHSVRIDEDYGIWLRSINYPNKEVGIRSLSGGEKVVVSLVAMLALYQLVVGGKIGFLALDEPTEYLDTDRREELVNVLKEFQGGRIIPQLLVVTHDENVREAGDKIFRVFKENGYSKIKAIEPGGDFL